MTKQQSRRDNRPGMPAQLHDVLKGYTNATREVSGVISRRAAEEKFNSAIEHFNSAKTAAVDQCDALS